MEEENKSLEEVKSADVDCADCTGNWIQAQIPPPPQRLFTPQYFVKWVYLCQKCGLKSKIFCTRIGNKVE